MKKPTTDNNRGGELPLHLIPAAPSFIRAYTILPRSTVSVFPIIYAIKWICNEDLTLIGYLMDALKRFSPSNLPLPHPLYHYHSVWLHFIKVAFYNVVTFRM